MGRKGKSLSIPGVDKVEVYRAFTTLSPLQMGNAKVSKALHKLSSNGKLTLPPILNAFRDSAEGRLLHAVNIPAIAFSRSGIRHDFFDGKMSSVKLAIITNYERMNYLTSHSTVLETRIDTKTRYGIPSKKKENWIHFWEIRGRTFIGNKLHGFLFSIYQDKSEKIARVYDFKIWRVKKNTGTKSPHPFGRQ